MRLLVQRSKESKVEIENKLIGSINNGLVVFVSFTIGDNELIVNKMIDKLINLRIFEDENDLINLNLLDIKGEILSISQFTLYADTSKGRRPSFVKSLEPFKASELYDFFNKSLKNLNIKVSTGKFGANMKVNIINDGPFTILLDSK